MSLLMVICQTVHFHAKYISSQTVDKLCRFLPVMFSLFQLIALGVQLL